MLTITFIKDAHNAVYDALRGTSFYNDDIDLVDSNSATQATIAHFTHSEGAYTGITFLSNATIEQVTKVTNLLKHITV